MPGQDLGYGILKDSSERVIRMWINAEMGSILKEDQNIIKITKKWRNSTY